MSSILPSRRAWRVDQKHTELIVPALTAAALLDYGPPAYPGATTLGEYVDQYILADFNVLQGPGGALERRSTPIGGRAVYVCLKSEGILSSAPVGVATLVASLPEFGEKFVLFSTVAGDAWIVASRAEGLRHGLHMYMERCGVRWFGPHPSWGRVPRTGTIRQNIAELRAPTIDGLLFRGDGGLRVHGVTFAGVLQDMVSASKKNWSDMQARQSHPRTTSTYIGGDSGTNITFYRQREYRANKTMLAWTASAGLRGVRDANGTLPFPSECFPQTKSYFPKLCATHHGTAHVGPGMPDPVISQKPWEGVARPPPSCTIGTDDSGSNDPNPQGAANPSGSDYTSYDGGIALFAEHTFQAACETIGASPDPYHPNNYAVSTSPTDGSFECECENCIGVAAGAVLPRLRSGGLLENKYGINKDTTQSDLVLEMSNYAARRLASGFTNSSTIKPGVAITMYGDHTELTSLPSIEPNTTIGFLPQTAVTSRSKGELIDDWVVYRAANPLGAFQLAMQPTWSITSDMDIVTASPFNVCEQFKSWISKGFTAGFSAQTSYSQLAMGCVVYVCSRLAWDNSLSVSALVDEWFTAFGAAGPAMRKMYDRWWAGFELSTFEIAQSYADCQAAQTALSADSTHTQAQQDCLDHLRAGVHWLRLVYEYQTARRAYTLTPNSTTVANFNAAADAAMNWCWSVGSFEIINFDTHYSNIFNALPVHAMSEYTSLTFNAADHTATRSTGSWITDGFVIGDTFAFSGSVSNNLTGVITNLSATITGLSATVLTASSVAFVGETYTGSAISAIGGTAGTVSLWQKWLKSNSTAAGWVNANQPGAVVHAPTTAELTTLMAAGVASYPATSGVTIVNFAGNIFNNKHATAPLFTGTLVPVATTASTTLIDTINFSRTYQTYRFRKPAGNLTFHLKQARETAVTLARPTRIRVLDANAAQLALFEVSATNLVMQDDAARTITGLAAGDYTLEFNDDPGCNAVQHLQWPENVPLAQCNLAPSREFEQARKCYFYVPLGLTKIAMSYDTTQPIVFYKPGGTFTGPVGSTYTAQTTTSPGPRSWLCDVPAGLDGKVWAFDHSQSFGANHYARVLNCPSWFSFSPYQVMVPSGLDGYT